MTDSSAAPYRWRWAILGVMLAAEIMDMLDTTIVNVAGPSLETSLGMTTLGLQWVIGGYALALGAGLVIGGRLGDRHGRRRLFLLGLAVFTLASLMCSLAPTSELLIAFRIIQGAAGALLLPQGLGLLRENLSGRELAAAFGVFGPVLGLGGILGPVIGGGLIEADLFGLGWRTVFLVNVPIGIAALVVAARILPRRAGDRTVTIDPVGGVIVVASSGALMLALTFGPELDWPAWAWACVTAGVLGLLAFGAQQYGLLRRGGVPLVTATMFRRRAYSLGLIGIALFFSSLTGTQLVLTLFLQLGNGFTAGEAGLGNLPLAIGSAVGGALSGAWLAEKIGRSVLQLGAIAQIAGAALLWVELGQAGEFSIWIITPGIALFGAGGGAIIAALFSTILAAVKDEEIGSASGVLTAVQAIASALGVAVFTSIFFDTADSDSPAAAFQRTLVVPAITLTVFLALSFAFPRKAKEDAHAVVTGE